MAWLLDTNVLSKLRRPRPDPKVLAFVTGSALEQLHISVVTLAEIRFGIELVGDPNRRVLEIAADRRLHARRPEDVYFAF
jgi:predicted nucleic acid-binding protein